MVGLDQARWLRCCVDTARLSLRCGCGWAKQYHVMAAAVVARLACAAVSVLPMKMRPYSAHFAVQ